MQVPVLHHLFDTVIDEHAPSRSALRGVRSHRVLQRGRNSALVGSIALPAFLIDEFREARRVLDDEGHCTIAVSFPGGIGAVEHTSALLQNLPGLDLGTVTVSLGEVPTPALLKRIRRLVPDSSDMYAKPSRGVDIDRFYTALMGSDIGAVLDVSNDERGSLDDVTESIIASARRGVGLVIEGASAHAISGRSPDRGHREIGIVNLLCAVDAALDAGNAHDVRDTLATQVELASRVQTFDVERSAAIRQCLRRARPDNTSHVLIDLAALELAEVPDLID
ncbi:MAG: hypothetical protein K0Q61_142 [Rhodococcus erythropolis]|jgi:hypothetical protein|nr:hypothetical protein [Rhodococcus erythropolis]